MEYLGTIKVDGDELTIVRRDNGSLTAVGYQNEVEDWVLVEQSKIVGGPCRRRIHALEEGARAEALRRGLIRVEPLGLEGYTSEAVTKSAEFYDGPAVFTDGDHCFSVEITTTAMPIQGRGTVSCSHIRFVLLPSRRHRGELLLYGEVPKTVRRFYGS